MTRPLAIDLFSPPPMISGSTNGSGRDVWYDFRRCNWTTDPIDLFLSDDQLIAKYGEARAADGAEVGGR